MLCYGEIDYSRKMKIRSGVGGLVGPFQLGVRRWYYGGNCVDDGGMVPFLFRVLGMFRAVADSNLPWISGKQKWLGVVSDHWRKCTWFIVWWSDDDWRNRKLLRLKREGDFTLDDEEGDLYEDTSEQSHLPLEALLATVSLDPPGLFSVFLRFCVLCDGRGGVSGLLMGDECNEAWSVMVNTTVIMGKCELDQEVLPLCLFVLILLSPPPNLVAYTNGLLLPMKPNRLCQSKRTSANLQTRGPILQKEPKVPDKTGLKKKPRGKDVPTLWTNDMRCTNLVKGVYQPRAKGVPTLWMNDMRCTNLVEGVQTLWMNYMRCTNLLDGVPTLWKNDVRCTNIVEGVQTLWMNDVRCTNLVKGVPTLWKNDVRCTNLVEGVPTLWKNDVRCTNLVEGVPTLWKNDVIKLGLGASETWLWGQASWALWASVETGLWSQCRNWALWDSTSWAWGPMWKLGLWVNVETRLWAQCGNWAYGPKLGFEARRAGLCEPVWKLGLGASVETRLRGQPHGHIIIHTLLNGDVICECQGARDTQKLPQSGVWEKGWGMKIRMKFSNEICEAAPVLGLWVDEFQGKNTRLCLEEVVGMKKDWLKG
ncbi:hypothetical protein V8G54_007343 [Vigna mungo]|uniref:Uncharacterized protein n=1 Tax=Vigna mungo TaxID=3915 RepID=A0AAQ3P0V3_VIGMU